MGKSQDFFILFLMIIFLSPAKTLKEEPVSLPIKSEPPMFFEQAKELGNILKKFSVLEIEKLMKVSSKIAELNFNRFQKIPEKLDKTNSYPALCCFEGDVYKGIMEESFSKENWEFTNKHVRILSGMYGILKPTDLLYPYRLEMGTKLENPKGKNLYEFWKEATIKYVSNLSNKTIINLASEEYFKAIPKENFSGKIINIVFKDWKNDSFKIIGIYAKRARGVMTNWIIKNSITDTEKLKNFSENGYSFSKNESDQENFVFARKNS